MNPPSDLARRLHATLVGARGLTLLALAHRNGLMVPEAYPGLRWLLRWGFAESKARIGREAVYIAVRGKVLPPAPARPPRVRVRKPDSYGKPPAGWDAADDLERCMKPTARCWHCNGKFSNMSPPKGQDYWYTLLEIEPGRMVKVHKCCVDNARESVRHLTAQPPLDKQAADD